MLYYRAPAPLLPWTLVATLRGVREMDELVPVKNKLRMLRAERGWSQAELAERLGVSRQTVNSIETERYEPSLSLAFRISRLFSKRIEDVFDPS